MKTRFLIFFLVVAGLLILFVVCFSNELGLWLREGLGGWSSESTSLQKTLDSKDSQKIVGYRLVDLERDARRVEVRDFRASMDGLGKVDINLTLVNTGSVHFPNLRVFMKGEDSRVLRTLNISPQEYGGKGDFGKQQVVLHIPLLRGESRVAVTPYYDLENGK